MRHRVIAPIALAGAFGLFAGAAAAQTSAGMPDVRHASKHVLLISVDGMHQSDLAWFVAHHPHSAIAQLVSGGTEYTHASTSNPSDSDPGGTALMTGGNPKSTGIYYDVEYSHKTDEPGAKCTPGKPATGGDVIYDSPDDALASVNDFINPTNGTFPSFDENGSIFNKGLDKHPAAIMGLHNNASSLNPATFPVDPKTCTPITPWDYLGDNSIFQVAHRADLRTAWSDKHAVYLSFNGPGSHAASIDDFFGPEIDSQAVEPNGVPYPQDDDWAHIEAVRRLQGPGRAQPDQRPRPLREANRWHSRHLRDELPGRLGRAETEVNPGRSDRSRCPWELPHERPTGRRIPVGWRSIGPWPGAFQCAQLCRRTGWSHAHPDP